uniref:Transmembrane protein 198 n=1 Tax=Arion vulgaris TaxID=1028688 RepID=A0A0B6XXS5_9EUPU
MSLVTFTSLTDGDDQLNITTENGLMHTPNVTIPWLDPSIPAHHSCDISTKYGILSSIIAAVCFIFGILYTFFGYRFFKAIMFLTGFIFGAVLVYMIILEQDILPPEGILGCAAGAGILLGLLTMLIQHIGLFLTGFNLGVAAVAVILVVVEQFVHISILWIPIGIFLVLGVIFGILSLRFQKTMTVIGTSVFGAAIGLAGIDYFVELCRMALYIWDRVKTVTSSELCWFSWLMFAIWPAYATLGAIIQWKFTSVGVDHRLALRSHREQGANLQQVRAREKKETQQTRYRHLYQARRVKGDVISQNFIHSMQPKLPPAMQSLTALNTESNNEEESTATTTLTHVTT